jgi:lactoylglutathione lyase
MQIDPRHEAEADMASATRVIPMLSVADMAAARRFYAEALGGAEVYRFPPEGDAVFVTLGFGDTELGLGLLGDDPIHGRPLRPATGHRIELCLNVPDVDAAVAGLAAIGAEVVTQPADQPWGERAAYVEDFDGNLVLLVAPIG